MFKNVFAAAIMAIVLMGCGANRQQMVKAVENYSLPVTMETNSKKSLVYIVRPDGMAGLVSFEVAIGDTVMGKTLAGQYIYFYLTPGDYKILSRAENTAYLQIMAEAGQTYFIKQTPAMEFLYARNELSLLDDVEGKYSLKMSNPGEIKEKNYPVVK